MGRLVKPKSIAWVRPREHGAWGMLLTPFVAALLLARSIRMTSLAAAVVVLGVFLIREPLVVLWRQAYVWRERRAESDAARRSLVVYLGPTAAAGLVLLARLPRLPLLALGLVAALLTVVSAWLIVQNRQRSVLLQLASAAGLNASALLAWLSVRPRLEPAAWFLWALLFAHSAAAVLVVHARLEARAAARAKMDAARSRRRALTAQLMLAAIALALCAAGRWLLAMAPALSATLHLVELARLHTAAVQATPLRRVGLRALAVSIAYTALVVAGLLPGMRDIEVGDTSRPTEPLPQGAVVFRARLPRIRPLVHPARPQRSE